MKKIVLLVGPTALSICENIQEKITKNNKKWEVRNLAHINSKKEDIFTDFIDFNNKKELRDYFLKNHLISITARGEKNIPELKKILDYTPPHILLPNKHALEKATEKTKMRKAFLKYSKKITPNFLIVNSHQEDILPKIHNKFEFPVIIKPSGLAGSAFVQLAYSDEDLIKILKKIFEKINKAYTQNKGRGIPKVIIEEYIEGEVFSLDVHVDDNYNCYFNPLVKYKMANQKGFDDFFVYEVFCPVSVKKEVEISAQEITIHGLKALGLKNCTAHVELIKDINGGWKIIEIGPRIGGNRIPMYKSVYDIDIDINDILIHANKKPKLKTKAIGHISVIRFYPKKEGFITKIQGIKKAKNLESFYKLEQKLKVGDKCISSRMGGKFVFKVTLFNENKKQLVADKRKLEEMVHIETIKRRIRK